TSWSAIPATFAAWRTVAALTTAARGGADGIRIGFAELFHRGLATELDAALVVDEQDLDLDLLPHLDHVVDAVDVLVGELGDVAQPVGLRSDLHEGAEV